jgi:glycine/D-amino acid oxidase-like deaminating enzyme
MKGNKLQQINTSKGDFSADEIVVAAGAWTQN